MAAESGIKGADWSLPRYLIERSFRLRDVARERVRYYDYRGDLSATRELGVAEVPLKQSKHSDGHEFEAAVQHGCLLRVYPILRRSIVLAVVAVGDGLILDFDGKKYDLLQGQAKLGVAEYGPFRRLRIEFADGHRTVQVPILMPILQALFHDPATDFEFTEPANFVFRSLRDKPAQVEWQRRWREGIDPVMVTAYIDDGK